MIKNKTEKEINDIGSSIKTNLIDQSVSLINKSKNEIIDFKSSILFGFIFFINIYYTRILIKIPKSFFSYDAWIFFNQIINL